MAPKMYDQVLKETKVASVHAKRQAALSKLSLSLTKLDKLKDQSVIKVSTFKRLQGEIEVKIETLEGLQTAFHEALMLSEPALQGTEEVKNDLNNVEELIDSCNEALDDLMDREELKGLMQPKPDPTAQDLASIISAQVKAQTDGLSQAIATMSANQTKAISSITASQTKAIGSITANLTKQQDKNIAELIKSKENTAPKPTQPFFTSKQNDSDFANLLNGLPSLSILLNIVMILLINLNGLNPL